MTLIGYHASHEQFAPSALLCLVSEAEKAGFACAKSSDHFHPWSERQGHSGFAWSWLGAAMQTTSFGFGMILAPGYRYHPAVLAQAAATIGEMFPDRLWLSLGTGEAINEAIIGEYWPEKTERNARLRECVDIFRALFAGETVTHRGRVTVVEAKLYSRPQKPVPIFGAAVTTATAAFCGSWADGLLTTGSDIETVSRVVKTFRDSGGEGKPVHIQHALSWAPEESTALAEALDQWSSPLVPGDAAWELRQPRDFDAIGSTVTEHQIRQCVAVSSDPGRHRADLEALVDLRPAAVHLHCVGRNQRAFIDMAAKHLVTVS